MKKFYYKKDPSLGKSPIDQPLERRHTLDVDKNGKDHDQSRVTTRTKSVSSVHLLQDEPTTSTAKAREITKSLSEDVLSKSHVKKPAKVITETDLASSGLYKARKASMNSKDTPQKIPQPTGLSPVALKDPKLKPVPIRTRARSKKSQTCLCYFAIMMAISVCTIGVLATVTGILYNEIISSENLTSAESSESKIDYSNLIPEFRLLNDNYSETNEFNFNNETIQLSLESTDTSIVSENETFTLHEDQSKENVQIMGIGQLMDITDLSQFLDNQKAEIKFKDGDTIIYELNSSRSSEFSKMANNLQMKELDSNENKTKEIEEPSTFKDINTWPDKVINEKLKEPENLEVFIDSQSKLKDIFTANEKDEHLLDENRNTDELKDFVNSSSNVKFENASILGSAVEHNKSELFNSEESQSLPKSNVGDIYDNQAGSIIPERSDNNEKIFELNDLNNFTIKKRESEPEMYEVETFPVLKNTDMKILAGKSEHDVDSMLRIINEDEEASNTFLNRNGEISPLFENSSSFETKSSVNIPISQLTTQRSQGQQMSTQEAQHMKPMDMKVSLAEAMKHLQALDANNTFLTSRMKSIKSKSQNAEQRKLTENSRNKQNITMENIKYLQNLRLLLQENLLRN